MGRHILTSEDRIKSHKAKHENSVIKKQDEEIKKLVYGALKDKLLEDIKIKKGGKSPYYQAFVDRVIEEGVKYPGSVCGKYLADMILKDVSLDALDKGYNDSLSRDLDFQRYRIEKQFYDNQREVLKEINHRRRILCITSRRCGKTQLAAGACAESAITPNTPIIYINLKFQNAVNQLFDLVVEYSKSINLEISKSSKAEGRIEWANGSTLQLGGNATIADTERYRGFKARLVIIDEVGHQKNLDYLLEEVLFPLMADYADSTLLCVGTPSRQPKHFSSKLWEEDDSFAKYTWDMTENPYIPDAVGFIEDICRSKGIDVNSPFIQREYFGRIVADTEALVFPVRHYKSDETLPRVIDGVKIGVDFGFSDYNAIVCIAYNKYEKKAWIMEEQKFNHATVSEIMDKIKTVYDTMKQLSPNVQIFCDTNEESITADLRVRLKLPAFNAYKVDKMYAINTASDMCRTRSLLIDAEGILDDEMSKTLFMRNDNDDIINELDDDSFHPDAIMAMIYALRPIYEEFGYEIPFKLIVPNSAYTHDQNGTITGLQQTQRSIDNLGLSLV